MTPRNFLVRGLLAGLLASFVAFLVAYTVGEPQIDTAIDLEESASALADPTFDVTAASLSTHGGHGDEGTTVSRTNQSTWGLLTGLAAVGTTLGGVIGLAAAFALGRLGRLTPGQSTAAVAAVGFVALWLVPFMKYPATPPAVGSGETIGDRTLSYFSMQSISVVAAVIAVIVAARLYSTLGSYRAVLAGAGGYLAVVIVAAIALPTVNELGEFPADTLWYFRQSALFTNVALWGTMGVLLVGFVGRQHQRDVADADRRAAAAAL